MKAIRRMLVVAGSGLAVAACGGTSAPTVSTPESDLAIIRCEDDGTVIDASAIRTQVDGVHLRVENPAEEERMVLIYRHGSHEVPPGGLDLVSAAPPGQLRLACVAAIEPDDPAELDEPDMLVWPYPTDDEWEVLEVVDVDGVWTGDTLACDYPTGIHPDYPWDLGDAPMPEGEKDDPVELARRDLPREIGAIGIVGLGDVLEPAGYVGRPGRVRLVRGGETIAVINYRSDGRGGWHVGATEYCDDEEPSDREPADPDAAVEVEPPPDDE